MTEGIVSPTRSAGMVEAIVTLPFSLLVDATCLGTTTSELIGSIPADIVLPGLTAVGNSHLSAPHIYSIKSVSGFATMPRGQQFDPIRKIILDA